MIIKSLSRRNTQSFNQILNYLHQDKKTKTKHSGITIRHNLAGGKISLAEIEAEFVKNADYMPVRKNGVIFYHEILSLSSADTINNPCEILQDLARVYLEKRACNALAYGVVHLDTDSPHIHLVISGNEIKSQKKVRLSRREFSEVKKETETYQKQHYPELIHSVVFSDKKGNLKNPILTAAEQAQARRIKEQGDEQPKNHKQTLAEQLKTILLTVSSPEELQQSLTDLGLSLYQRGKSFGVQTEKGRKYRFKTLGLDEIYQATCEAWKQRKQRLPVLNDMRQQKAKERVQKNLAVAERIKNIIRTPQQNRLKPLEQGLSL